MWRLEYWRGSYSIVQDDEGHVACRLRPRGYRTVPPAWMTAPSTSESLARQFDSWSQRRPESSGEPLLGAGFRLVLVSGLKRAGKDSFARRLVEAHGFARVALGDPLRACLLAVNPHVYVGRWAEVLGSEAVGGKRSPGMDAYFRFSRAEEEDGDHEFLPLSDVLELCSDSGNSGVRSDGWDLAKPFPDVRSHLQRLGQDAICYHVDPLAWVKLAVRTIVELSDLERPARIVLTDLRDPRDLAVLRTMRPILVRIDRTGLESDGHASERPDLLGSGPDWRVVDNSGSLADLERRADELAAEVEATIGVTP